MLALNPLIFIEGAVIALFSAVFLVEEDFYLQPVQSLETLCAVLEGTFSGGEQETPAPQFDAEDTNDLMGL